MARLAVIATGMVTAVGFNSDASCAAVRAGVSGVTKSNLYDAESGEGVSAGKVNLRHWWEGQGKLAELVAPAIHECLVAARPTPPEKVPILLGVAHEGRPFRFTGLDEQLLEEVEYRLGLKHNTDSKVVSRERVSGVVALNEARGILESGRASSCIVAGVDSFLQQPVVEAYIRQRRILTSKNSNGFIPGEAGCAVLITVGGDPARDELTVLGIGFAKEPAPIESEAATRAEGLTQAVRVALNDAGLGMHDTAYRITDLNGEHYKFKEASFVQGRLLQKVTELHDLWHPIEFLGDIGAAIVPCVLAVALHASKKQYAPGPRAVCHFSNDNGERAAVVTQFKPWGAA